MVHPGCGADIIRQRRRKDELRKEQIVKQLLEQNTVGAKIDAFATIDAIYAKNTLARAKNKRYHGHYTPARDSQVFNKQRCSSLRLSAIKNDINTDPRNKNRPLGTKKLFRHNSVLVTNHKYLKNQDDYRSKSLEQEAPPSCTLGNVRSGMAVKSNDTSPGKTKSNVSSNFTESLSTSTILSQNTSFCKQSKTSDNINNHQKDIITTQPTINYDNGCSTFSDLSSNDEKFNKLDETGVDRSLKAKPIKTPKNFSKMYRCNPFCCFNSGTLSPELKKATYNASELEERTLLNCKLNSCSEMETHTNGYTMIVPTNVLNETTSIGDKTSNIIPPASQKGLKNLEGIISFKEAFRILCLCPVGCSSYRHVSRLNSLSEGLERCTNNEEMNTLCDITMDDILEEDVSFYMDLPLTINMIAEFDEMTIP
jgi:hypothetical protein